MQVQESKETMRQLGSDPYFLTQDKGSDTAAPILPFWCAPVQRWCAPFVMEAINSRVVHRSNALAKYGPDFKYREAMQVGDAWPVLLMAAAACDAMVGHSKQPCCWIEYETCIANQCMP
jgi:short subunit dehydrogenase-like uncharacterized protein